MRFTKRRGNLLAIAGLKIDSTFPTLLFYISIIRMSHLIGEFNFSSSNIFVETNFLSSKKNKKCLLVLLYKPSSLRRIENTFLWVGTFLDTIRRKHSRVLMIDFNVNINSSWINTSIYSREILPIYIFRPYNDQSC